MLPKLELYAIIAIVLLAVTAGAYFKGHHTGYESAKDEFAAAALEQANKARAFEQSERDRLVTVSQNYEQQIAQIRVDAAARPTRSVRCVTTDSTVSSPGANPGGSQSQATAQSSGAIERDIGNPIYNYADDFKACAIQVNSLLDAWPK